MATLESDPLLPNDEQAPPTKRDTFNAFVSRNRFYICIVLIKISHTFFFYLFELPLVRLIERSVCQEYYKSLPSGPDWHHPDEELCKLNQIQTKVAYIIGFRQSFKAIPGLVTAIGYGALADKWGRRPIFALACLGESLALCWILLVCYSNTAIKIEAIWVEALFYFAGGGTRLVYALIFTMIADYVPAPVRSRFIFFMHSIAHMVRIPSLLVSSALMDNHLWLPFVLAFSFMAITFLSLAALPETLPRKTDESWRDTTAVIADPVPETPEYTEATSLLRRSEDSEDPQTLRIQNGESSEARVEEERSTVQKIRALVQHPGLLMIFGMFFLKKIAFEGSADSLLYQYASQKFNIKLSHTFGVRLAEILGAVVTTLIILPLITHIWQTKNVYNAQRDMWIFRGSTALEATCFLLVFGASHIGQIYAAMTLCGLGQGLEAALQALGSFVSGPSLNAGFFTSVTFLDTSAEFLGGPIMASLFSISNSHGVSAGYCFLASGLIFVVMFFISFGLRAQPIRSKD